MDVDRSWLNTIDEPPPHLYHLYEKSSGPLNSSEDTAVRVDKDIVHVLDVVLDETLMMMYNGG